MGETQGPWWKDRRLWWLLAFGLVIRIVPLAIWNEERCARDECTYMQIAGRMMDGEGMTSSVGWIWPPGYPFFLALHGWVTARRLALLGEPQCLEEVVGGEGGQDMILYYPVRPA